MTANPWDHDDDGTWLDPFVLESEVPDVDWEGVEGFCTAEYFLFKRDAEKDPDTRRPLSFLILNKNMPLGGWQC